MELSFMRTPKEKNVLKLLSLAAIVLLVFMALSVFLFQTEMADPQPSSVGLYMRSDEGGDARFTLDFLAGQDDTQDFELKLENWNTSDDKGRTVLLYVLPYLQQGEEENWEFEFTDATNAGIPVYTGTHPEHGTVDLYRYLVLGDGTQTNVTFQVKHDFEVMADNDDDMEYLIKGIDYESADEPTEEAHGYTVQELKERFWKKILERDGGTNHNVTYLMDDEEQPNVDVTNAKRLRAFIPTDTSDPECYPKDPFGVDVSSISMVADEEYDELLVYVTNEGKQDDELQLQVEMDDPSAASWTIKAQAPHAIGTYYPVDKLGDREIITLLISLKDPTDYGAVPEGPYSLKLTVESKLSGLEDEETVTINLQQRWKLEFNLDPTDTDTKDAETDGTATTFTFNLKNAGTMDDSIAIKAEVQNLGSRAGDTNDEWTKVFYPTSPISVAAGETIDVLLNLTPKLDNEKIPPGQYPVYVNVSSTNNLARTDQEMVYIKMPNLYNPDYSDFVKPAGDVIQIGTEGLFTFTVKNSGKVDDTFTLSFSVKDGDGTLIASDGVPGDWVYTFEDDSGVELEDNEIFLAADASEQVRFKLTPPAGLAAGDYDVEITISSAGPTKVKEIIPAATFTATRPDLTIDSVEIVPDDVKEGDEVTIKAAVRLHGATDKVVKVEFHYHTAAAGFTFIGEEDLDFGGKADTVETVEFKWKAKKPQAVEQNIKVLVDATDVVDEADENNNEATGTITVEEKVPDEEEVPWVPIIAGTAAVAVAGILILSYLGFLPFLFAGKAEFIVAELTVAPEAPKVGEEAELTIVLLNEGKTLEADEQEIMVSIFEEFDPIEELDVSATAFERDEETELPAVKWTPKEVGERPITVVLEVDGDEVDEYTLNVVVGS